MHYPALEKYLDHLKSTYANPQNNLSRIHLDEQGRAIGKFFKARLSSVYQTIRDGQGGAILAYEAYARSFSQEDSGLSVWRLLENAANDDESVELDRLCRLLHTINYFRQVEGTIPDLYLSVHNRLLTAVSGNHGAAFRHVLEGLGLPQQPIVLQLPAISLSQRWVLSHVTENYKRNGFRIAALASSLGEAQDLLGCIRPEAIKLDASRITEREQGEALAKLLIDAQEAGTRIILRKIEKLETLQLLHRTIPRELNFAVQGFVFEQPNPSLERLARDVEHSLYHPAHLLAEAIDLPL